MKYATGRTALRLRTSDRRRGGAAAGQGTDLQLMRESNRLAVLNCIRENDSIPRAEVARRTGLSRTTVGNIMETLLGEGLVREGDSQRAEPSGGRRIVPVHFNATAAYVLGVAMGRRHLTIVLCDLSANVVKRTNVPFPTQEGPDVCLPLLGRTLRQIVAEQRIAWGRVIGVGVGMPGPLSPDMARPAGPPRMPGWSGVGVRDRLRADLGVPVYLDNNANMGALGESRYGSGKGVDSLLYVKAGSGIGGGMIVGGQLYRGSSGSAGELGHMTVDPDGPLCDCGNRGCLEALVGTPAIVASAARGRPEIADIAAVIRAAERGDTSSVAALARVGTLLGTVLANLVNFFNPALIVLDGGTLQAGELVLKPLRAALDAHSLTAPLAHTRVTMGALSGTAIAMGGAAAVLDAAFDPRSPMRLAPAKGGQA